MRGDSWVYALVFWSMLCLYCEYVEFDFEFSGFVFHFEFFGFVFDSFLSKPIAVFQNATVRGFSHVSKM